MPPRRRTVLMCDSFGVELFGQIAFELRDIFHQISLNA